MNNMSYTEFIADENAILSFAQKLVQAIRQVSSENALVFYLNGDLGAGKTTLSRGIVQAFGHQGNVKSPTYTLVEEYHLAEKHIYHFDLYRLSDPEELEFMGIRDYFSQNSLCLIEWAEKGKGLLEQADLLINIAYADTARQIELVAQTEQGKLLIELL